MKTSFKNRLAIAITLISITATGCATTGSDGTQTTDSAKSAALGAGIGALVGNLIGDNTKSTLIGAAIGGGAGYLIAENEKKKELAGYKTQASEITRATNGEIKPVVYTQQFENTRTRERVEGFRHLDMTLPIAQIIDSRTGALTQKGVETFRDLDTFFPRNPKFLVVPSSPKPTSVHAIARAAPNAKIIYAKTGYLTARVIAIPDEKTSVYRAIPS